MSLYMEFQSCFDFKSWVEFKVLAIPFYRGLNDNPKLGPEILSGSQKEHPPGGGTSVCGHTGTCRLLRWTF